MDGFTVLLLLGSAYLVYDIVKLRRPRASRSLAWR